MTDPANIKAALLGVWRLIATRAVDQAGTEAPPPYGKTPLGLVQFEPNGRMQCVLTDGRGGVDPAREYLSYTGEFSLSGSTLTTVVDGSSESALVLQRQIRNVSLDNQRLTLWWAPGGGASRREFVWKKL